MPRRREPIEASAVARNILSALETYATDSQFYPTQNGLYSHMKRMGYDYSIGRFNYWFFRLVEAGRIEIDWSNTRAIRATSLAIVERDSLDFPVSR